MGKLNFDNLKKATSKPLLWSGNVFGTYLQAWLRKRGAYHRWMVAEKFKARDHNDRERNVQQPKAVKVCVFGGAGGIEQPL